MLLRFFNPILKFTSSKTTSELDEDCRRILTLASGTPKTPPQISKLADIPITRCWEKVRLLESMGMIRTVLTFVGKNGRAVRYYETLSTPERPDESGTTSAFQVPTLS